MVRRSLYKQRECLGFFDPISDVGEIVRDVDGIGNLMLERWLMLLTCDDSQSLVVSYLGPAYLRSSDWVSKARANTFYYQ